MSCTRSAPVRNDYETVVGTVSRTVWLDDTSLTTDSPYVTVRVVDGRELAQLEMRVLKKGTKYRTEWLDESPIRIFDGATSWHFFHHPSDYAHMPGPVVPVESSNPARSPLFYELPPQPVENSADGLDALSTRSINHQGREVIEVIQPVSRDRSREPGYRYLFDPGNGFMIRASYGDDEIQVVEWRDVQVDLDLDDDLFTWTGPTRNQVPARAESG